MTFRLYPEELHWWSFADYAAVMGVAEQLRPERVLEFGPGSSTLALIEGGAGHVDACEDQAAWADVYRKRFAEQVPGRVTIRPYAYATPLTVPGIDDLRFDLAFIDGPADTEDRPPVVEYCIARSTHVLIALECHPDGNRSAEPLLPGVCRALAAAHGRSIREWQTGALAGAFALIGPPC